MRDAGAIIEVRAVAKRYAGGIVALDGIDLAIARGTVTAVIGANGSGKSTLLKILAGVLHADAGSVRVLGFDPVSDADALQAEVGYVAQGVELDPEMTGLETLQLFATLYGAASAQMALRIEESIAGLELAAHLPRRVSTYSGGLRQRLHIALAFVQRPQLLLMDEPTAALDPAGRAAIWRLMHDLSDRDRTVVLITHDTIEAARHCALVVLLHHGRVAAMGPPEELVAHHARWTLTLTLARPVDGGALAERIDGVVRGVEEPICRGSQAIVQFAARDSSEATRIRTALMERLESAGEAILGFTLEPPDLSSAYFKLTGATVTTSDAISRRGRGMKTREPRDPKTQASVE